MGVVDEASYDTVTSWHQDPLECRGLFSVKQEMLSPTPGGLGGSGGPRDVKPQLQGLLGAAAAVAATASDLDGAAQPEGSAALQEFEERLGLDASQLVVMNGTAETDTDVDVDVDDDSEVPVTKVCDDCGLTYIPCPDKRLGHRCRRSFRCKSCSWTARSLVLLRAHEVEEHESRKPFECGECKKRFGWARSLREHTRMHAKGSSTCACPGCGAHFDTTRNLTIHQNDCRAVLDDPLLARRRGGGYGGRVVCALCSATFCSRVEVARHVARVHTTVQEYKCDVCVAWFKTKAGLKQHLKVHQMPRPYTCSVCAARFSQPEKLLDHLNLHLANPKREAVVKGELGGDLKSKRLKNVLKRDHE